MKMHLPTGLALCLLGACSLASAADFVPKDHGLRYLGKEGRTPVVVEITLSERLDGTFDYTQWTGPRSWGAWFNEPKTIRARLRYTGELLAAEEVDTGDGAATPPPGLPPGTLDPLSVRLRARGDIARGLKIAEYQVWNGGDRTERWTLAVSGAETVTTPNGNYQALKFRLGSESEWIDGWSAPLLTFHFVKIDTWRDGRKLSELSLDDKQL
jgi:hypothetical protein